jgi:hypothetical protein
MLFVKFIFYTIFLDKQRLVTEKCAERISSNAEGFTHSSEYVLTKNQIFSILALYYLYC